MRIAHISDLHLRQALLGTADQPDRLSRQMPDALAAAVALTNDLAPDLLLITGDLLDYPQDLQDDPATRQRGLRDYGLVADALDKVACRVLILLGNHDHPELLLRVFGHDTVDWSTGNVRIAVFPKEAEDAENAPSRTGLDWDRQMAVIKNDVTRIKVMAQHYVVWPQHNVDYTQTHVESDPMPGGLANPLGTTLCLSGHFHDGVPLVRQRGVWFAAVPALCTPPHPLWLYDASETGVTSHEYRVRW